MPKRQNTDKTEQDVASFISKEPLRRIWRKKAATTRSGKYDLGVRREDISRMKVSCPTCAWHKYKQKQVFFVESDGTVCKLAKQRRKVLGFR